MKNEYEVRGEVTAIFIKHKGKKLETIISTSSLERVSDFKNTWYADYSPNTDSFYVKGKIATDYRAQVTMNLHRWIMDAPKGMLVDHVNHDTLDNTLTNLRLVTHSQNQQNRKGEERDNRTWARGVTWSKRYRKWEVAMIINGKKKYFGSFDSLEEAKKCSADARKNFMPYATC